MVIAYRCVAKAGLHLHLKDQESYWLPNKQKNLLFSLHGGNTKFNHIMLHLTCN